VDSYKIDDLEKALKFFKDKGAKEIRISNIDGAGTAKGLEIEALGGDVKITVSKHWEHSGVNMYKPPKITETKPL
jgi:hypothetical protein